MKRRTAIASSTALGGLFAALFFWRGWGSAVPWGQKEDESLLARSLRKSLPMLNIPPETLEAYRVDDEERLGPFRKKRASHSQIQRFLLSTDFFPEADESKALTYVSYYDPYSSPCRNPFRGTP